MTQMLPQSHDAGMAETGSSFSCRVMVVEDDAALASEIALTLQAAGHSVALVADGNDALREAGNGAYDLLILDRLLPGLDGLSLLAALRANGSHTPVLVISALNSVDERVRGLKAGGDDYLTKPFALLELSARVEALLRRPAEARQSVLRHPPLAMDLIGRTVTRDGAPVELLPREFKLLEYLMRRPGQLVTRAMLLEDVWNYRFVPQTNLVDVHIGKLRRKIDAGSPRSLIESVRGAGFVFAPD